MKKTIDKIVLFIFYLLCLFAFLLIVDEIPEQLNNLFNTTIFYESTTLSFAFCVFIVGYTLIYFKNQSKKYEEEQRLKLIGLYNFKEMEFPDLKSISKITLSPIFDVDIEIQKEYNFKIGIQYFSQINNLKLHTIDNEITEYIKNNSKDSKNKTYFEYMLKNIFINTVINR